jgi:hypothetical protein
MNEIEEFYSYVEMPQVAENVKAWNGSFSGGKCLGPCLEFHEMNKRPRMDSE